MDDNNLIKSDNSDTQRLCLKVILRVDSAVCPRDRTVTQPLHDNANTDELAAHLAHAVMDLIHFTSHILQKLYNALLAKREDVV